MASRDTRTTDGLRVIKMERAFFHSRSYFENGWAEEITSEGPKEQTWYLPHHIVSQQGPEAMKYRIVVDGSVNFEGTSLNEQLDSGPKLQADLLGILLRFRRFQVALQSDITSGLARGGPRCLPFSLEELWTGKYSCDVPTNKGVIWSRLLTVFVHASGEPSSNCHTIAEAKDFVRWSSELLSSGGFYLASNAPEALVNNQQKRSSRTSITAWEKRWASWNPQEDERLMDELTYDKRFELRSWLLQWAVLSSHAAIGRIAFMHEQDTWIAVKT
ncbi:hypothetical protein T02_4132 [Trichinella nativa]|uniref:Uncharacterized protein n=1 Tax=Trichinella nativa TaxID=6335 RepID=A0A0V1L552_9BILA|nr:hypothetical protein T02_4132 [Trichinella nativa]